MKNIILLALLTICWSCNNTEVEISTEPEVLVSEVSEQDLNDIQLQSHRFMEIDSSGMLIIPLEINMDKEGRVKSSYKSSPKYYDSYWNIVFYNARTSNSHLLTKDKVIIHDYTVYKSSTTYTQNTSDIDAIFYLVQIDDLNDDNSLDQKDPTYLFVSDKKGNNFRQLSPKGYDVQLWEFLDSVNKVVLTGRKDINNDQEYNEKDEVEIFEVSLTNNAKPVKIWNSDFEKDLKIMFAENWQSKEN